VLVDAACARLEAKADPDFTKPTFSVARRIPIDGTDLPTAQNESRYGICVGAADRL